MPDHERERPIPDVPGIEITPTPEEDVRVDTDQITVEEYAETVKRLKEAEKLANEYKSVADSAKKEVKEIKEKRNEDEVYLQTAVKVASSLYRRNTMLSNKNRSSTISSGVSTSSMPSAQSVDDRWNEDEEEQKVVSELFDDVYSMADDVKDQKLYMMRSKTKKYKNKCKELEDVLLQVNDDYVRSAELNMQAQKEIESQKYEIEQLEEKWQVETQVRRRAETYAAKMYGKNKAWQRKRSMMLPEKSEGEKTAALEAEIDKLSKELEQSKLESKLKIQELEEALVASNNGLLKELEDEVEKLKVEIKSLKERLDLQRRCPIPPPPPPPVPINLPKVTQTSLAQQIAKNKADQPSKPRRVSAPSAVNSSVMVNAMEELFQRIKSGNAGLKQTGLKPTAEEDKSTEAEPFDHIYTNEVKELKKRLTIRPKAKNKENNTTKLYSYTLSKLKPVDKGHRVLRPVPEVPNVDKGLHYNPPYVNQKLNNTHSRYIPPDDGMHPELRKVLAKRKKATSSSS